MKNAEKTREYMQAYNKRPEVVAYHKSAEYIERRKEQARKRYAYAKTSPHYREIYEQRRIRHYTNYLRKNGYTVIEPKEADE